MKFKGNRWAFPLGGIGAPGFSLSGSGRLVAWQMMNNFHSGPDGVDGAVVPLSFFLLWCHDQSGPRVCLLQKEPVGQLQKCVTSVEGYNRFPLLRVEYQTEMPVEVWCDAWSPFIPTKAKESATPVAIFEFALKNKSQTPLEVALLFSLQNIVGWEGTRSLPSLEHEEFIGNRNTVQIRSGEGLLECKAESGVRDSFAEPIELYTFDPEIAWLMRLTENVQVRLLDARQPLSRRPSKERRAVLWLTDHTGGVTEEEIDRALSWAEEGGVAIFSGWDRHPLLFLDRWAQREGDSVLFDFEDGTYRGWEVSGNCFGKKPAEGTQPRQQPVSGFQGRYLINTFMPDDTTTGRALSSSFTIDKRYLHFLIGGGNHPGRCCVNLLIEGKVVRSETGRNREELRPVVWDLQEYVGREGQLEVVDEETGPWGHILADYFVLSWSPLPPVRDPEKARRVLASFPWRWSRLEKKEQGGMSVDGDGDLVTLTVGRYLKADGLDGGEVLVQTPDREPLVVRAPIGNGAVLLVMGAPTDWAPIGDRKRLIGALLMKGTGVSYRPMTGWWETAPAFGTVTSQVVGDGRDWILSGSDDYRDTEKLLQTFGRSGLLDVQRGIRSTRPSEPGKTVVGALSGKIRLKPGETRSLRFLVGWNFPNRYRTERYGWAPPYEYRYRIGNQYNRWFQSATDVIAFTLKNYRTLYSQTKTFSDSLWDSSLPEPVKDAVASNLAILRSGVMIWLEDQHWVGFEGADNCCPMNCTHVYNYVQSVAFCFPELERSARDIEWKVQQHPEKGYIPHRVILPLNLPRLWERGIGGPHNPALDGMLGAILKTYREYLLTGDKPWLTDCLPHMALLLQHIFATFDPQADGVIRGEQPNTYDIHTFGSNTFIGSLYLCALKAFCRAVEAVGREKEWEALVKECQERIAKGQKGYVDSCWNGEYFINAYDSPGADPEVYERFNCWGPGCHSDQLLGQWWAYLLGLGDLFPKELIRSALGSIFRYNWRRSLRGFRHSQRVFAAGDEKGLIVCTWPNGGRPRQPILYCDEVWTGHEYEVAALLFWNGFLKEGLEIVEGARARYDGTKRNPFAELECGHYYSRALSSWSLLISLAGFQIDAGRGRLELRPVLGGHLSLPLCGGIFWGVGERRVGGRNRGWAITVQEGSLYLTELIVGIKGIKGASGGRVTLNKKPVPFAIERRGDDLLIQFPQGCTLSKGDTLVVAI